MVFKTYIYFHDDFTKEIDYYVNKISYKKDKWCSEYQKKIHHGELINPKQLLINSAIYQSCRNYLTSGVGSIAQDTESDTSQA